MKSAFDIFSSLKLTVYLLFFLLLLVFFSSIAQVESGIFAVQKAYFHSFIAFWSYPQIWSGGDQLSKIIIPLPGGYIIGPLIIMNLFAANIRVFHKNLESIGLTLIHSGLILLILGQWLIEITQHDSVIWLKENESTNYSQSFDDDELAIIDTSEDRMNRVATIPTIRLKNGAVFDLEQMGFTVKVKEFYSNSVISGSDKGSHSESKGKATHGMGKQSNLRIIPQPSIKNKDLRNAPSAIIEISKEGSILGSWMVSTLFEDQMPDQHLNIEGSSYKIEMRIKRHYMPFSIQLTKMERSHHPGTDIPNKWNSEVSVKDPLSTHEQSSIIRLNHPLRYMGYTFYQSTMDSPQDTAILQVVRSPVKWSPYISCLLIVFGLLWQFLVHLWRKNKEGAGRI